LVDAADDAHPRFDRQFLQHSNDHQCRLRIL
jgi:hypothetical protein